MAESLLNTATPATPGNPDAAQDSTQAAGGQQQGSGQEAKPAADAAGAKDAQATPGASPKPQAEAGKDAPGKDATGEASGGKLELGEKSVLDATALADVQAVAKEMGLSTEQAQKLLDHREQAAVKQREAWTQQTQKWVDEVKADKEVGGQAFDANIALARGVIEKYGTPEFKAALNETGLGNHPELVRFMVKIGRASSEDGKLINGNPAAGANRTLAETMYPDMKPGA